MVIDDYKLKIHLLSGHLLLSDLGASYTFFVRAGWICWVSVLCYRIPSHSENRGKSWKDSFTFNYQGKIREFVWRKKYINVFINRLFFGLLYK